MLQAERRSLKEAVNRTRKSLKKAEERSDRFESEKNTSQEEAQRAENARAKTDDS